MKERRREKEKSKIKERKVANHGVFAFSTRNTSVHMCAS